MRLAPAIAICMLPLFAGACASIKTENKVETVSEIKPIEVKPIHIILDINVKVDKDLDKFFPEADKKAPAQQEQTASAAQQPAAKSTDHDAATPQATTLTPEQQAEKEATKARFAQRLPVILDLKKRGIVAENNKGFLQFMGEVKESEDVVAADNADRKAVFDRIAMRQGTTPVLVGQQHAKKNAEKAFAGEWLQDSSGHWSQKE